MSGLWLLQTAAERLADARAGLDTPLSARLVGVLGVAVMIGIAVLLSHDRRRIDWRLVGAGLLVKTFVTLRSLDTGFNAQNLLTAKMSLRGEQFESSASARSDPAS